MKAHVDCSKLVLGTVQLGLCYGLANATGRPDQDTATRMVAEAWAAGIRCFDTAQAYGESEKVLGSALAATRLSSEARVISKTRPGTNFADTVSFLADLRASLASLGLSRLGGLLLHREDDLAEWMGPVGRTMVAARAAGLAERLGVSVYSLERAQQALAIDEVKVIQVAANLFDRRMDRAGFFTQARERGKEVFIRSLYLQGLVLSPQSAVARGIPHASEAGRALEDFCRDHGVTAHNLALSYVRHQAPEARFILGAETVEQVRQNCAWFREQSVPEDVCALWTKCWPQDHVALIDPRTWPMAAK